MSFIASSISRAGFPRLTLALPEPANADCLDDAELSALRIRAGRCTLVGGMGGSIRRYGAVTAVALAGCACGGCSSCAGRIDARGADTDVARFVHAHGATLSGLACQPVGDGTRAMRCLARADPSEIASLVAKVPLSRGLPPPTSYANHPKGCRALGAFARAEAYVTYSKKASGFDYVLVMYQPTTRRVCIEVEYGWG